MFNVEVDAWADLACASCIMTHAMPASGPKGRKSIGPAVRPG